MAGKKKPQQTLADYVTIALSPVLIMALVGSLIFFLLEVLYVGQYSGRMQWTLFFFVFGMVLIARISIEQGGGKATLYGLVMALVVWFALQAFMEYPAGSPMKALGGAINLGLIAIAWWCAHRLTWDCTYIDDRVDATGKGVLEAAGLEEPAAEGEADPETDVEEELPPRSGGLLGWWDRYCQYRQEQLRKPHTPGVWVVYFSLAALPLFGLGQSLIPTGDVGRRHYAFWLMACYVASGLALLVTTSFLGLRRYLRQRKLKMPVAMTGMWMALGGGLIVLVMVAGALLPRPYGEYQLIPLHTSETNPRNASRYAVLREGAGKGEGRPSSDKASRNQDAQPRSGSRPDEKQGEAGEEKDSGGKASSGGKGTAKDGKSSRQDSSQGNARSGDRGKAPSRDQANDQPSKRKDAGGMNRREDPHKGQSGSQKPGKDGADSGSDPGQSRSTELLPHNPLSQILEKLGWLGTVLKWLVFVVLALVALFFLLRSGLRFLANFTDWARNLLEALQAWWEGLFGRAEGEPEAEDDEDLRRSTPRPFVSFTNPFLDGRADQLSPDALTRYSFEALQAWAWEHDMGRQAGETPLEFAERLSIAVPQSEAEVRSLVGLYVRLAYARNSLTPASIDLLRRFWQRLEAMEEKPVSV